MRKTLLPVIALLALIANAALAAPLESYRGTSRPVIVFGPEGSRTFQEQLGILNRASAGLRERDMVLITVPDRDASLARTAASSTAMASLTSRGSFSASSMRCRCAAKRCAAVRVLQGRA